MPKIIFPFRFLTTSLFLLLATMHTWSQNAMENKKDSVKVPIKKEGSAIKSKIKYQAQDSILFSVSNKIVRLYHKAIVDYETVHLEAEYIEINFNTKTIKAFGLLDTNGILLGRPEFSEGTQNFESDTIIYNYETKKGIIYDIFTQQGEGFLHGEKVKKLPDNTILVRNGAFTTCDLHDPHFAIRFDKAKVIPNDKIITGPVWLEIEDITTPLALPFGFFPNKTGAKSGIVIPKYGQSASRGFFLEEGGYYFAISDYLDLSLLGGIYSRGDWNVKTNTSYKKKYKYEGSFSFSFSQMHSGDKLMPDYSMKNDYMIKWRHVQDPKARPKSRFSADVTAGSSSFSRNNMTSTADYLTSSYTSSISYSTTFGSLFNFSTSFRHTQNKLNHSITINFPELALSSNKIYPFRPKVMKGKPKAFQNINISYQMNARNEIVSVDSLLFDSLNVANFSNGVKHVIPITWNQKILKYANFSISGTYTERWYLNSIEKKWNNVENALLTDTMSGFHAARDYIVSSQINTKLYVFYSFGNGPLKVLRQVITPSISYSWRPDFSDGKYGYYKYYLTPTSTIPRAYSIFSNGIYGYPPSGKYGSVNFSISNNFELKIRNRKDSITGAKKITLIDNLTFNMSRNLAADTLQWTVLGISGRTKLFKNLDLSYILYLDPYAVNEKGERINQWQRSINGHLFRRNNDEYGISANYQINNKSFYSLFSRDSSQSSVNNFRVPWNLTLSYVFRNGDYYFNTSNSFARSHGINFNGEIRLTPNWKISGSGNYDILSGQFTVLNLNIHRDLHCWEILFNWIPLGYMKSYNMTIRVKATMLQDLKLTKKTDWRDAL